MHSYAPYKPHSQPIVKPGKVKAKKEDAFRSNPQVSLVGYNY